MAMNNTAGWFEIQDFDMTRAIRFYKEVLVFTLRPMPIKGLDRAWFFWNQAGQGAPGRLVCNPEFCKLSAYGMLVYLSSSVADMNIELDHMESARSRVLN